MSDFAELMATVEQVRAERYSQVPPDLVRTILTVEAENPDDRKAASGAILQAVLRVLAQADPPSGQAGRSNA